MRPDGKLEPGKPLTISARAWNRAQDAANRSAAEQTIGTTVPPQAGDLSKPTTITVISFKSNYQQYLAELPAGVTFGVGSAIALNSRILKSTVPNLAANQLRRRVDNESELPKKPRFRSGTVLEGSPLQFLSFTDSPFGIVTKLSIPGPDSTAPYVTMTLAVSGIIQCLIYAFGSGTRVTAPAPPPRPNSSNVPPNFWRPYPVVANSGPGLILGIGSWYRINPNSEWPQVQEALIEL